MDNTGKRKRKISIFAAVVGLLLCCCCDYGRCCCQRDPMLCHCLLDCIWPKGNRTSWHRLNLSQVGLSARRPKQWGQTGLLTSSVYVFGSDLFYYNCYWWIKLSREYTRVQFVWKSWESMLRSASIIDPRGKVTQNSLDIWRSADLCNLTFN